MKKNREDLAIETENSKLKLRDSKQMIYKLGFILSIGLFAKGLVNARRIPEVKKVDLFFEDLPEDLEGLTIVQLTDFHIGQTIDFDYVSEVIHKVNEINPDLVAITGDLIDGQVQFLKKETDPFKNIKSKYGTFYVTGNHEYYWKADEWINRFKELGLHVLENSSHTIRIQKTNLLVAGVTDLHAHNFFPEKKSDPAKCLMDLDPKEKYFKLLLAHQPKSAFSAAPLGFDLQLSGHTHGGQYWPATWIIHAIQPFVKGINQLNQLTLYVSEGTGYWGPPTRLGTSSEITLLTLKRKTLFTHTETL